MLDKFIVYAIFDAMSLRVQIAFVIHKSSRWKKFMNEFQNQVIC